MMLGTLASCLGVGGTAEAGGLICHNAVPTVSLLCSIGSALRKTCISLQLEPDKDRYIHLGRSQLVPA